jgi:cytoskeletal protein RodZ
MESDIEFKKRSDGSAIPVEEPHFDEEATLLARRVVPISGANSPSIGLSPTRRNRPFGISPLFAVTVIVGALVVGLIGGLMITRNRKPANENTAPIATAEPVSADATNTDAPNTLATKDQSPAVNVQRKEDVASSTANPDRVVPVKEQKPLVVTKAPVRPEPASEPVAQQVERPAMHPRVKVKTEDRRVDENGDVDERNATRREERRQRRVRDGELGDRQIRRTGREIDRIRDIFLGTP